MRCSLNDRVAIFRSCARGMRRVTNLIPGKGMNSWSTSCDATVREVTWHAVQRGRRVRILTDRTRSRTGFHLPLAAFSRRILLIDLVAASESGRIDQSRSGMYLDVPHANDTRVRAPMTQMTQYATTRARTWMTTEQRARRVSDLRVYRSHPIRDHAIRN